MGLWRATEDDEPGHYARMECQGRSPQPLPLSSAGESPAPCPSSLPQGSNVEAIAKASHSLFVVRHGDADWALDGVCSVRGHRQMAAASDPQAMSITSR